MNFAIHVQTLENAISISHSANALGKSMNTTIVPLATDKSTANHLEGKLIIKPVILHLKWPYVTSY